MTAAFDRTQQYLGGFARGLEEELDAAEAKIKELEKEVSKWKDAKCAKEKAYDLCDLQKQLKDKQKEVGVLKAENREIKRTLESQKDETTRLRIQMEELLRENQAKTEKIKRLLEEKENKEHQHAGQLTTAPRRILISSGNDVDDGEVEKGEVASTEITVSSDEEILMQGVEGQPQKEEKRQQTMGNIKATEQENNQTKEKLESTKTLKTNGKDHKPSQNENEQEQIQIMMSGTREKEHHINQAEINAMMAYEMERLKANLKEVKSKAKMEMKDKKVNDDDYDAISYELERLKQNMGCGK